MFLLSKVRGVFKGIAQLRYMNLFDVIIYVNEMYILWLFRESFIDFEVLLICDFCDL